MQTCLSWTSCPLPSDRAWVLALLVEWRSHQQQDKVSASCAWVRCGSVSSVCVLGGEVLGTWACCGSVSSVCVLGGGARYMGTLW